MKKEHSPEYRLAMYEVEVHLQMKLADAMGELRVWLDHNDYVPVSFEISKKTEGVLVRMVFAEDRAAREFKRSFAR
ncbi:MAG TPA: hypothetical protein VFD87_16595 [Phototrophicaceae bacterium]|nr:hypothetical protein [Phototrophicaceae bacterium]